MRPDQFQRQIDYGTVMSLVREMLDGGLISRQEFAKLEAMYAKQYQPIYQVIGVPEPRLGS